MLKKTSKMAKNDHKNKWVDNSKILSLYSVKKITKKQYNLIIILF
jgi:hypothetical protein